MGENSTKYKPEEYECCLVQLIDAFNEIYKYKEWMVPIGEVYNKIDNKIIGETYIINGPSQSGKTSLIYWALRNDN
jgi:ABC-type lipoprotein export system ATPase subunit